jgi:hypothetical protein
VSVDSVACVWLLIKASFLNCCVQAFWLPCSDTALQSPRAERVLKHWLFVSLKGIGTFQSCPLKASGLEFPPVNFRSVCLNRNKLYNDCSLENIDENRKLKSPKD